MDSNTPDPLPDTPTMVSDLGWTDVRSETVRPCLRFSGRDAPVCAVDHVVLDRSSACTAWGI